MGQKGGGTWARNLWARSFALQGYQRFKKTCLNFYWGLSDYAVVREKVDSEWTRSLYLWVQFVDEWLLFFSCFEGLEIVNP